MVAELLISYKVEHLDIFIGNNQFYHHCMDNGWASGDKNCNGKPGYEFKNGIKAPLTPPMEVPFEG